MIWQIFLFIIIVMFTVFGIYYFIYSEIPEEVPTTSDKTLTITWTSSSCDCTTDPPGDCCGDASTPTYLAGANLHRLVQRGFNKDNLTASVYSSKYTKIIVKEFEFFNDQGVDVSSIYLKNTSSTSSDVRTLILLNGETTKPGQKIHKTFSNDSLFLYVGLSFIPSITPVIDSKTSIMIKCKFI